jgi:glycerophosphoryl diester phosphodiesterase
MVTVLYTFDRQFMRKTFAAIDTHLTDDSAVLWLDADDADDVAGGGNLVSANQPIASAAGLDAAIEEINPDVVEAAHREGLDVIAWKAAKTRGEIANLRAAGVDGVTADRWDIA